MKTLVSCQALCLVPEIATRVRLLGSLSGVQTGSPVMLCEQGSKQEAQEGNSHLCYQEKLPGGSGCTQRFEDRDQEWTQPGEGQEKGDQKSPPHFHMQL